MNTAQRKSLLASDGRVRKTWRRWFRILTDEGVGETAARERADIEAAKRQQEIVAEERARFAREEASR